MMELGILVVGAIIGFITGALVYRNNAAAVEARLEGVEETLADTVDYYEEEIAELRQRLADAVAPKTKK